MPLAITLPVRKQRATQAGSFVCLKHGEKKFILHEKRGWMLSDLLKARVTEDEDLHINEVLERLHETKIMWPCLKITIVFMTIFF